MTRISIFFFNVLHENAYLAKLEYKELIQFQSEEKQLLITYYHLKQKNLSRSP